MVVLETTGFDSLHELFTPLHCLSISLVHLDKVDKQTLLEVASEITALTKVVAVDLKLAACIAFTQPVTELLSKFDALSASDLLFIFQLLQLVSSLENEGAQIHEEPRLLHAIPVENRDS